MEKLQWLNEKQIAETLGVRVRTVQQWRFHGRGPRYKKLSRGRGGSVRYDPRELDEWLKQQPGGGDPLPVAGRRPQA
jgi:phage terminase Nu1 subunit (DNA packaging protein)